MGASRWTTAAASWTDAFTAASREARTPGGTEWEGMAAEAAQSRTEAGFDVRDDLSVVDRASGGPPGM